LCFASDSRGTLIIDYLQWTQLEMHISTLVPDKSHAN